MGPTNLPATAQDDDLTDEQVEQMLLRATERLKRSSSTELAKKAEAQRYNFPKLQTGQLKTPYVSSDGNVATLDSKRVSDQTQRKGANGIRRVEDPLASKKAAQEVRHLLPYLVYGYEEIFPNSFLEQSSGTVLVRLSA